MQKFEAKIRYAKTSESGKEQVVNETILIEDTILYREVEEKIHTYISEHFNSECNIQLIKVSNISEVIDNPDYNGSKNIYYRCKVDMVTIDELAGKEKKMSTYYLVLADNIDLADKALSYHLRDTIVPWEVSTITDSKITEVIE